MIFEHHYEKTENKRFYFNESTQAVGFSALCNETVETLFHGFAFRSVNLNIIGDDKLHFLIGQAQELSADEESYCISISESGVSISAQTKENLFYGFFTFLDLIRMDDNGRAYVACCQFSEKPLIKTRMLHFCVFPETEIWEITKIIRLCAALKYSHLIIEFWGMLKYDCCEALSWSHAFSKEELKEPLQEARNLGLEIVPMFNHWGHASGCRQAHGKHVVLDSHPEMQAYFSESGWSWNFRNPKVRRLLSDIRRELIDLCGNGKYFHIGGDEAEDFSFDPEETAELCDFLNEIAQDIEKQSRNAIMWGDMLLTKDDGTIKENSYSVNCPDKASQAQIISRLSKNILIADWQYWVEAAPIETSLKLSELGYNVLVCPWDRSMKTQNACLKTVLNGKLFGAIHTTWHTLSEGMPYVGAFAATCWGSEMPESKRSMDYRIASAQRRVFFTDGDYKKSGWSKKDTDLA